MTTSPTVLTVSKSLLIVIGTLPENTACGECRPVESRLPTGLGQRCALPTHSTGATTAACALCPAAPEALAGQAVPGGPATPARSSPGPRPGPPATSHTTHDVAAAQDRPPRLGEGAACSAATCHAGQEVLHSRTLAQLAESAT